MEQWPVWYAKTAEATASSSAAATPKSRRRVSDGSNVRATSSAVRNLRDGSGSKQRAIVRFHLGCTVGGGKFAGDESCG